MLCAGNDAAITQLRNQHAGATALLRLDNRISGGALRNRLDAGHDAYCDRAAAIRAQVEDDRDAANAVIRDRIDRTQSDFEAVH